MIYDGPLNRSNVPKALNVEVGGNVDIDHVHLAQVVEVEPVY
jgi:hypothetical protein